MGAFYYLFTYLRAILCAVMQTYFFIMHSTCTYIFTQLAFLYVKHIIWKLGLIVEIWDGMTTVLALLNGTNTEYLILMEYLIYEFSSLSPLYFKSEFFYLE